MLTKWENLPDNFKTDVVKEYYDVLKKKQIQLVFKRIFDILFSLVFIAVLLPFLLIISVLVVIDSGFPIIYLQERVTKDGMKFKIFKFRTMVNNADKIGSLVTTHNDNRITKIGGFLRKYRLDELPQIFNILFGSMSFVGTRPEVQKYVDAYSDEMFATLLLPAGVTSIASIEYKDEASLLEDCENVDEVYINTVLPHKMEYNLKYLKDFSLFSDIKIIVRTAMAIIK